MLSPISGVKGLEYHTQSCLAKNGATGTIASGSLVNFMFDEDDHGMRLVRRAAHLASNVQSLYGIAAEGIIQGETGTIVVSGIVEHNNQSGGTLTAGQYLVISEAVNSLVAATPFVDYPPTGWCIETQADGVTGLVLFSGWCTNRKTAR